MSLRDYKVKRKFDKTPEPEGIHKQTTGPLSFVIQKHQASRLHYDFRLEFNGVLKSWAVPKGPSLNPQDKRLAVMVEDHPIDYAHFEGIIPKDNYGAGTVMVWDKGVYSPIAFVDREQAQVVIEEQIKAGHLTFILLGEKLQGEFALVKTKNSEENAWLLFKANDEYATKKDILLQDRSVISGRSLDQIKKQARSKDVWLSKPSGTAQDRSFGTALDRLQSLNITAIPKGRLPQRVKPMLAQTSDQPFTDKEWLFEMKYDGYRAIAEVVSGKVKLYSRNGISFDEKFSPIVASLKNFPGSAVLDGEVVVVDEQGYPHFQWLQDYPNDHHGELIYFVFDLLHYDGHDLTDQPLYRRKDILKQVLPPLRHIKFSDHIIGTGVEMFQQIQTLGLEGIMAKHMQSTYKAGNRTTDWLKIKTQKRQEVIIAGFTKPKGGRKHFGSLIVGIHKEGSLVCIGHVGGGFDDKLLAQIYDKLQPLIQKDCPFDSIPEKNAPATWVKPKLLAEITFSNWTTDGQVRHPIFIGLRDDKNATDATEERYFAKDPIQKSSKQVRIGKKTVTLTNLSKIFWPIEGYTKGDVIAYYREIAPAILPHLRDRPQSMLRYPNGIDGKNFYQKDASNLAVDWIEKTIVHSESGKKDIPYLLCQNEASMVYLNNLGCIDFNPWSSRIGQLDHPDYLIIDLDPEGTSFRTVVETALTTREVLEQLEIPSYIKTSGAKGMHIYIPLGAKYTYEQSRNLAELLCLQVHKKIPAITSMKRNPKDRQGLVYLDYLQNIQGQTLASVYSVRAQPGATVSTPLVWSEVNDRLHPSQFTIKNVQTRLQKHGDLFKEVLGKGIVMEKILNNLTKLI